MIFGDGQQTWHLRLLWNVLALGGRFGTEAFLVSSVLSESTSRHALIGTSMVGLLTDFGNSLATLVHGLCGDEVFRWVAGSLRAVCDYPSRPQGHGWGGRARWKFDSLALLCWRRLVGVKGAETASIRSWWLVRFSIFHKQTTFTHTLMGVYERYDATTDALRVNDCVIFNPRRLQLKKTLPG